MSPASDVQPISVLLRKYMAEERVTFRELATQTRAVDRRGLSHTYLVQMARGTADRTSIAALEIVAAAIGIEPATIAEYRLALARRQLDPAEVGLAEALETLQALEASLPLAEGTGRRAPVPESLRRRAQGAKPSRGGRGEGRERGAA